MKKPEVTLAYVAGIIDGEGCISIRKTKPTGSMRSTRYAATITVGNTSRDLIRHLVATFSWGGVSYRAGTKTRRACYLWTVQSANALELVRLVRPYLVVKAAQADLLAEFVGRFDSFKGARLGHKGGIRVSDAELGRRAAIYGRMRALNRVGPRKDDRRLPAGRKNLGLTAEFHREATSGTTRR